MTKWLNGIINRKKQREFSDFAKVLSDIYLNAPVDFGGGCSYQKALVLGFYIKEFDFKTSVDIGVYRGRSLYPQAIAHRDYSNGIAYAVDPYDNVSAVQNDRPDIQERLDSFAANTDFDKIFDQVVLLATNHGLEKSIKFIRKTSHDASMFFAESNIQFGLIHIDGNHDTLYVMQDVIDYLPLLQSDGIIILDDISWNSVKPAFKYLEDKMLLIGTCIDNQNDFAVFVNKEQKSQQKVSFQILKEAKLFKK